MNILEMHLNEMTHIWTILVLLEWNTCSCKINV